MILTCPACSTRYRTDPDNFRPEGRRVRCSACGDVWFQTPPPEPEDIAVDCSPVALLAAPGAPGLSGSVVSTLTGRRMTDEPVRRSRRAFAARPALGGLRPGFGRFTTVHAASGRWRAVRGWMMLAAVILIPLGGALLFSTEIVNAWPKAARIYSALGVPVTASGLLIHANYSAVLRDGHRLIEVRGEVENQGPQARSVPPLQLTLYDTQQRELSRWVVPVSRAPLDPKGRRAFRTTFPAQGNVKVQIRFSEKE